MAGPPINDTDTVTGTGTSVVVSGITVATGEALYVAATLSDGSPGAVTSVVWSGGGGALSSIADSGVRQSFLRQHWWRSLTPTPGTGSITVTPAASTGEIGVSVYVVPVDAGTPNGTVIFADGNGTADAVSGTVSSGTDSTVIDAIGRFQNAALSVVGGQTQLGQANQGGILQAGASYEAGAATVTTGWGVNAAGTVSNWQWVIGALSLNASTGGGGGLSITSVTPSTFSPGDTVTIAGTGFGATQGASTLDVGGEAQTVTSWSDTLVRARATRGALAYGAYTLTLTNGTAATYSVTLAPPVGWASYTVGTPAGSGLLPFTPPLGTGDQYELQTVGGLVAGATDGTFSVAGQGYVSFAYGGWSSGSGWGALNTYVVFAQSEANTGRGTKGGAFGFTGWFTAARRRGVSPWTLLYRRPERGATLAAGWQVFSDWVFQNPNAAAVQTLALGGAAEAERAGGATLTPGATSLAVGGSSERERAGGLTLTAGAQTIALGGVAESERAGGLQVAAGTATVALGGRAERESAGGVTVSPGAVGLALGGSVEPERAGGVVLAAGAQTLSLGGAAEPERAGGLVAVPGAVTVALGGLAEPERTGGVTVSAGLQTLSVGGNAEPERPGGAVLAAGAVVLQFGGVAEREQAGGLSVSAGAQVIALGGGTERERPGGLAMSPGSSLVVVGGARDGERAGGLQLVPGGVAVSLGGAVERERAGGLVVIDGGAPITPTWPAGGPVRIGGTPARSTSRRVGTSPLGANKRRIG